MQVTSVRNRYSTILILFILAGSVAVSARLASILHSTEPAFRELVLVGFERGGTVMIQGIVTDQAMSPIDGARVTLQASGLFTMTAPDGTYTLSLPDSSGSWIVAAKKGYYNAPVFYSGSSEIDFSMEPTPSVDNPSYNFLSPSSCSGCHPQQVQEWTGSPMAKAGINTWVHDIFSGTGTPGGEGGFVYLRDSVLASSNPESECASCHQPESWIESPFSAMEDPTDPGYPTEGVMHGISCEICHKIADVDESLINYPGIFEPAVTFVRPSAGRQLMYGLLADTSFHATGVMEAAYNPELSAEVCGACHQDKNDINDDHTFLGITSEPTYTEWAESPYSDPFADEFATCISCHMPATGASSACVITDPGRDSEAIRLHDIRGTTPEYLENAVELEMNVFIENGELRVDVDATNAHTGHHVPTGVTVRNMILLVEDRKSVV